MIQLERYKGTKSRHTCPACNQKNQFTRFVDDAGNYIADNVGICNRSSKCGYRYTAKQYYADNPQNKKADFKKSKKRSNSNYGFADKEPSQNLAKVSKADYIAPEHLTATIGNYDRNAFVQFLFDLFPDCSEEIQSVLKMYFVGTYENSTCFPYLDRLNRVCRGKLIRFNPATGNRLKGDFDTSSLVRKLK
ncbi:MAG TPA: PG0870-related protein, partial [Pyrinomonadaceae bacterium]|nr:PG0870-related protein [Pyrinomonadaceae bacterium]